MTNEEGWFAMCMRLVRLALFLGFITALILVYVAPRHAAATAARSVTFVTDVGGLNDNGFNHLGYIGTTTGAAKAHWKWHVIETTSPSDYVKNLTIAAQQSRMVVATGYSFGDAMLATSRKFPADKFVIIDYDYNYLKPSLRPKNVARKNPAMRVRRIAAQKPTTGAPHRKSQAQ